MRRTLLSLSLLLIGSIGYSQVDIPDVDISKRKEYVMKNYNVDSKRLTDMRIYYILYNKRRSN